MYPILLSLHSLVRWFVLLSLIVALYRAFRGWFKNKQFTKIDNTVRRNTTSIAHFQLVLGLLLYFISPLIDYFLHNFKEAVHDRQLRFFGMEHSLMMMTGIVIITVGSERIKRKKTDREKFKTMAIWFTIGLLVILSSIPWEFSPLVNRPLFRPF